MSRNSVWYDWPLILAYHSVSDDRTDALAVRVADFNYQMEWLNRHGYKSMTLAEFKRQPIHDKSERIVIITFDDGYADNYTVAFPILKRYGFVATSFLVLDYVNTNHIFWWDEPKIKGSTDQSLYALLTWPEIEEMARYGIEFGSHTRTHANLTELSPEECWREVSISRNDLINRVGHDIKSFCYPFGYLNEDVVNSVEKAGYDYATLTPTRSGIPLSHYTLRRVGIYRNTTPWRFRLKIQPLVRRVYEHSSLIRKFKRVKYLAWMR